MKKLTKKRSNKLSLTTETVRIVDEQQLRAVAGGTLYYYNYNLQSYYTASAVTLGGATSSLPGPTTVGSTH